MFHVESFTDLGHSFQLRFRIWLPKMCRFVVYSVLEIRGETHQHRGMLSVQWLYYSKRSHDYSKLM